MADMLVKLYTLPELYPAIAQQQAQGIDIRRAIAPEKHVVLDWVKQRFSVSWGSECDISFARQPVACFVAIYNEQLIGFACYDATCRNFFGPTGVGEEGRGKGTGKALLLACLHAMRNEGYGYAIIGGIGPAEFYAKCVGATLIEDSTPGMYRGMLPL